MSSARHEAVLFRMVLPDHICPFGVKAKQLLLDQGYAVDDRILRSREEVEAVKRAHGVATTPLIFLEGRLIGVCFELETHFREA